jgi:hypothetical protein
MINGTFKLAAALVILATTARTRLQERSQTHDSDAGISTLEIVVIGLGLFLIAGVAVGVFTTAVNSRLTNIK